ncbi:MAG TPA: hypothetical protein VK395_02405 [Gemmataceae bacterium]|nr:hypothetical protein [Gemmataceae bacterium]
MTALPRLAGLILVGLLGNLTANLLPTDARLLAQQGDDCGPALAPLPNIEPPPAEEVVLPAPRPVAEARAPAEPPTPVVAVRVRVPASVNAGEEIEYRICVENCSAAAAHHVLLRNPLPANARLVRSWPAPTTSDPELTWKIGTLEAWDKREIILVLTPTSPDEVKNCARVQFEHGQCVSTKIIPPSMRIEKNGPKQAFLHDRLKYQLVLTNTGPTDIANIQLIDILPAGLEHADKKERLTWILGTLAPGKSRSVEYEVTAVRTGHLCNKVVVAAAGGSVRDEQENCIDVSEAKLGLTMSGPKRRYLNMPATYELTVSNTGSATLKNVGIRNPMPGHTSFIRASDGGELAGDQVQWQIGAIAPGETSTVQLVLTATEAGRICNRAMVSAEPGVTAADEVCTVFDGQSALSLDVKHSDDPVPVGGTTTYTITVGNDGTNVAARVNIVATVPDQMNVVRAEPPQNRQDGQKVIYDPMTIPAGGVVHYTIEVKARKNGDVRFKVEMSGDGLTAGPVMQEESTTIYADLPTVRRKHTLEKPSAAQP